MGTALLTGAAVMLTTLIGGIIAFFVKKINYKFNDIMLSFASGIMLSASFLCLIVPSVESEHGSALKTIIGLAIGAAVIVILDKLIPHSHSFGEENEHDHCHHGHTHAHHDHGSHDKDGVMSMHRLVLFIFAIAFHHFPEGIAVGVSFGSHGAGNTLAIASGLALESFPETLIAIFSLISIGVSKTKAFVIALLIGLVQLVGIAVGYLTLSAAASFLPVIFAIAAGVMIYVVISEIIPETHNHGNDRVASYALFFGVIAMVLIESIHG